MRIMQKMQQYLMTIIPQLSRLSMTIIPKSNILPLSDIELCNSRKIVIFAVSKEWVL